MQQEVYGEVVTGEIVGVEPVIPTAQPVVGVQPSYAAEPVGAYKGYGEVAPPPPPPRIIDSRLVLVRRGSPNVLRFDHWQALQAGGAAPLTCHASHPGNGIGKMYPEERRFQEWRYTESKCVAARDACSVQLVQGKFLKRVDANLVLDVAFWKFHEGTAVNWVGGGSDDRTYLHGGGRDFRVNSDGSICLVDHPHLSLGLGDVVDVEERLDVPIGWQIYQCCLTPCFWPCMQDPERGIICCCFWCERCQIPKGGPPTSEGMDR